MAALPTPNLLSQSLNIIDPYDFNGQDPILSSSSMCIQTSQESQDASGLDFSPSLNSSQLNTSGLLMQHINTQKEVRNEPFN